MIKKVIRKSLQILLLGYEKIKPTKGIVTLLYHKTTDENKTHSIPNINLKTFEKQMRYLKDKGYHTLKIEEIYEICYKNAIPSPKSIIITFDDGYKENVDAYKILNKYGFTAICFTATAFINQKMDYMPFWYDKGEMTYALSTVKNEEFIFMGINDYKKSVELGIEFAPHTDHHIDVSRLENDVVATELQNSMEVVEKLTGREQICFSYPFGLYNTESKQVLIKCGIKIAFAVFPGVLNEKTDPYFIPRNNVPAEWSLFKLILTDKYVSYMKISDKVNAK